MADIRLKALGLDGAELLMTEYVVCLAERRKLRIVSAFFEIAGKLAQVRQGPNT